MSSTCFGPLCGSIIPVFECETKSNNQYKSKQNTLKYIKEKPLKSKLSVFTSSAGISQAK